MRRKIRHQMSSIYMREWKQSGKVSFCDLSKAIDSVNHEILIEKCAMLNIDSFWFQTYLKNRTHSTHLESCIEETKNHAGSATGVSASSHSF